MGEDGKINASIVESVLEDLKSLTNTLLVLKSTVVPDIVERLANTYPNFVYNPEFLTERNALWDFENPIMNVYGGNNAETTRLSKIYANYSNCEDAPTYFMTAKEAAFVKYSVNSFLATKVAFWNQMYELAEKSDVRYDVIKEAVGTDLRIGKSHMNVPGESDRRGFGGACFSKDIPALIRFSDDSLSILREAWNYNADVRNSYGEPLPREVEQHITFNKI
jgi:UDPglucose 6-dehydrogenase